MFRRGRKVTRGGQAGPSLIRHWQRRRMAHACVGSSTTVNSFPSSRVQSRLFLSCLDLERGSHVLDCCVCPSVRLSISYFALGPAGTRPGSIEWVCRPLCFANFKPRSRWDNEMLLRGVLLLCFCCPPLPIPTQAQPEANRPAFGTWRWSSFHAALVRWGWAEIPARVCASTVETGLGFGIH